MIRNWKLFLFLQDFIINDQIRNVRLVSNAITNICISNFVEIKRKRKVNKAEYRTPPIYCSVFEKFVTPYTLLKCFPANTGRPILC